MRARNILAICLSLALALPASAADAVHQLSLGGAGPTWTDIAFQRCDADHVVIINRAATVGTDAGRLITLANPPVVTTFSLPAPSNGYGNALAVGCNATTILVGGGQDVNTQNDWLYTSTVASPGTWTLQRDAVNATNERSSIVGRITAGPGAEDWTFGFYYQANPAADYVQVYNADMSPLGFGAGSASYNSGGSNFTNQCSGDKGHSNHYSAVCWASGLTGVVGFSGSAKIYDRATGPAICGKLASGTIIAKQSVGYYVSGTTSSVIHASTNGTDTHVCAIAWTGSAVSVFANQLLSSLSMVGGAYFGGADRIWSAGGTAYVGGGSAASFFSNESGSTYDLQCDSGVLAGVLQNVDVDRDSDATDNLLGLCSSGDLVYYGEELPVVSSGARPRPTTLNGSLRGTLGGSL